MPTDKRRLRRERTLAKIIVGEDAVPGYLRDLSKEGCQLALLKQIPVNHDDLIRVKVLPGDEIGVAPFSVSVTVAWFRSDPVYFLVGGIITPLAGEHDTRRLSELYTYYGS